ncbi:MAG TPA: hypothetical protein PK322_07885 [Opitutaceae bacterium]|nr:hypothetical protein [Opitutaceae bacterium]
MKKAYFNNFLQGVRELKAARGGALPAGSVRDRRWAGSLAAHSKNATAHDMDSVSASIAAGRTSRRAP